MNTNSGSTRPASLHNAFVLFALTNDEKVYPVCVTEDSQEAMESFQKVEGQMKAVLAKIMNKTDAITGNKTVEMKVVHKNGSGQLTNNTNVSNSSTKSPLISKIDKSAFDIASMLQNKINDTHIETAKWMLAYKKMKSANNAAGMLY